MIELIKRLVKQGVISEEQLHEAMIETPDKQMKGVAETLHTLSCRSSHPPPSDIGGTTPAPSNMPGFHAECCYFYAETSRDDPWTQPDHKVWVLEAVNLMSRLNLTLPSDLSKFLDSLVVTVKLVDNLLGKYPEGKEVLRKACGI